MVSADKPSNILDTANQIFPAYIKQIVLLFRHLESKDPTSEQAAKTAMEAILKVDEDLQVFQRDGTSKRKLNLRKYSSSC